MKSVHKKLPQAVKWTIRALPLAGVAATVFFNPSRLEQQFTILIVLVWLQAYFIFELFLAGR
jgi:hypothetical protein